jgi:glycosyltransferase involved in cell wall biosynthesis
MRKTQRTRFRPVAEAVFIRALDALAARLLQGCDVFIGMSGMSTRTATVARRRHGAAIWIERGSRHILSQKEILDELPGSQLVSQFAVRRELADYVLADTIVIPALHVERSFVERGVPREKLFRNPYGVDLEMFPPTPAPEGISPTVIMVGNWSMRKGCDVLVQAWRRLNGVRLLHVGAVLDAALPDEPGFEHYDAVPMQRLKEFYGQSHVFALASREEGMALVQAQALACGLRLVCSNRTGGEDLKDFMEDPSRVTVVPVGDTARLARALEAALAVSSKERGLRDSLGNARSRLSWRAYGERYSSALKQKLAATKSLHKSD